MTTDQLPKTVSIRPFDIIVFVGFMDPGFQLDFDIIMRITGNQMQRFFLWKVKNTLMFEFSCHQEMSGCRVDDVKKGNDLFMFINQMGRSRHLMIVVNTLAIETSF